MPLAPRPRAARVRPAAFVAVMMAVGLAPALAARPAATRLELEAPSGPAYRDLASRVTSLGGAISHAFPPESLIAELPSGAAADLASAPGVRVLPMPPSAEGSEGWAEPEIPLSGDVIRPAARTGAGLVKSADAGLNGTSDYLLGRIAVGIILVESDGTIDASTNDWTEPRENHVIAQVTEGLGWLRDRCPSSAQAPSFVYRIVRGRLEASARTAYEPIARPTADEPLWRDEIMNKLDSGAHAAQQGLDKVASFNESLRETLGTDWALTMFVVDSDNDFDGVFADGRFSYAYLGGPHFVMTWDNDGYTSNEMRSVAAHSVLHVFWALDEYSTANVDCAMATGYLAVPNQNSQFSAGGLGCETNRTCIMRGGFLPSSQVEEFTAGQVGWRDADGDTLADPVDTRPALALTPPENVLEGPVGITGLAQETPLSNANPLDPTPQARSINGIASVTCSVDGGPELPATAEDGAFGGPNEAWSLVARLSAGEHEVTCTATNTVGNDVAEPVTVRLSVGRRCASGDIWPDGTGDGRVDLCDAILGFFKAAGWIALNERDLLCGDVAPGSIICRRDHVPALQASWCTTGDDRLDFDDVAVMSAYAPRVWTADCGPCDPNPWDDEPSGAALRRAGDVAPGAGGDARVDIADAVRVLHVSVGLESPSAEERLRADVAPAAAMTGSMHVAGGNGQVDIADVVALLRASVGLTELAWSERRMDVHVLAPPMPLDGLMATVSGWPAWAEPGFVESSACLPMMGADPVGEGDAWSWACTADGLLVNQRDAAMSFTYRAPEPVARQRLSVEVQAMNISLGLVPASGSLKAR